MKLTRLVPVAVAAVALLAGCTPTSGTAAVVDGARLSEARVGEIIDGCIAASGGTEENFPRRAVVQNFLVARLFDRVAAEAQDVTTEQLKQIAQQQYPTFMADDACAELAIDSTKVGFLEQVDRNHVIGEAAAADVELNPRYGAWNPRAEGLFDSASLSVPAGR